MLVAVYLDKIEPTPGFSDWYYYCKDKKPAKVSYCFIDPNSDVQSEEYFGMEEFKRECDFGNKGIELMQDRLKSRWEFEHIDLVEFRKEYSKWYNDVLNEQLHKPFVKSETTAYIEFIINQLLYFIRTMLNQYPIPVENDDSDEVTYYRPYDMVFEISVVCGIPRIMTNEEGKYNLSIDGGETVEKDEWVDSVNQLGDFENTLVIHYSPDAQLILKMVGIK